MHKLPKKSIHFDCVRQIIVRIGGSARKSIWIASSNDLVKIDQNLSINVGTTPSLEDDAASMTEMDMRAPIA